MTSSESGTLCTLLCRSKCHRLICATNLCGSKKGLSWPFPSRWTCNLYMGKEWIQLDATRRISDTYKTFCKRHAKPTKLNKFLLLLDNYRNLLHLSTVDFCTENGIIFLSFPPHCSHRLQPLDVSVWLIQTFRQFSYGIVEVKPCRNPKHHLRYPRNCSHCFASSCNKLKATNQDLLLLEFGHSVGTPLKTRVLPHVT
jgi:hypothetical protein